MLASILGTETHDDVSRGNITIRNTDTELSIMIEAEDIVALRAALNSYLRLTKLAIETQEAIGVLK